MSKPPIRHSNHRFTDENYPTGQRLRPSVTTVTKHIDTAKLTQWAARLTARRAVENLQRISADPDAYLTWLQDAPEEVSTEAREFGDQVHAAAEAHILGRAHHIRDPDAARCLDHFGTFEREHEVHWLATEMTVYNRTLGYGGTLDALATLDGSSEPVVLDFKTGRTGPYPAWGTQVAAYAHADTAVTPSANDPAPPMSTTTGYVLRLRPDGYRLYRLNSEDMERAWTAFQGALSIWETTVRAAKKNPLFHEVARPTTGADWELEILAATSREALNAIWERASSAGDWTDELTERARVRVQQLAS